MAKPHGIAWYRFLPRAGVPVIAPWAALWKPRSRNVDFVLCSVRAAYRLRHDPHVSEYACRTLKAQFAALRTFDPAAPDYGTGAFDLAFQRFRGNWNALVAANSQAQPRRAAEVLRKSGEGTRDDVAEAWAADEKEAKYPPRGRIPRIALDLARPESTVRDAAIELGLVKPKKRAKKV